MVLVPVATQDLYALADLVQYYDQWIDAKCNRMYSNDDKT